jgi:hypothetical protein
MADGDVFAHSDVGGDRHDGSLGSDRGTAAPLEAGIRVQIAGQAIGARRARIIAQSERRVLAGEPVAAGDKLVSLFDLTTGRSGPQAPEFSGKPASAGRRSCCYLRAREPSLILGAPRVKRPPAKPPVRRTAKRAGSAPANAPGSKETLKTTPDIPIG